MATYKFVKMRDETNPFDHTDVLVKVSAEHIADILEAFKDYLLACGFSEASVKEYLNID